MGVTIPADYVIIAVLFFFIWVYLGARLVSSGISQLRLVDNSIKK
jgi:hypothetical protein